ncbi:hypothetical protein ALC62_14164 [Cyphomyrmex costatus]|uniref:Uncharacterized protein n=1 Tax=Cyphomyrmex costatus TaxID=456900 RepID=A0A195C516_9HYME|nr:hypothetical protein ALC62_14164 [Cyphomyrmex costatus]
MYISEPQNGHPTTKYASTNSIPAMMEQESSLARILGTVGRQRENAAILRDTKARRHSVLEDLKARRDSLFQRARRVSMFEEKENSAKDTIKDNIKIDVKDSSATKEKAKDKRRGSDSGRRGSVFYVSEDLLEENQEVLENEDRDRMVQEAKKARRKSWHPLVKPPKLDRKRRKGVSGAPSEIGSTEGLFSQSYPRQKRPSWWNIFVPESVSRQVDNAIQTQLPWDFIKHARILAIFFHTVHYIDYIIWARLRHKVTRFVAHEAAQIEFILCEFPGPRLVKTTPTASRVSVSVANVVPEQPDCRTQT